MVSLRKISMCTISSSPQKKKQQQQQQKERAPLQLER